MIYPCKFPLFFRIIMYESNSIYRERCITGDINRSLYVCNCSYKVLHSTTSKRLNVEVEDKMFSFFPPSEQELKK